MKNPLHFLTLLLILALFVGCGSTPTTKITQKDIFSEIKQKGKYKNPRKIDALSEIDPYKADSLLQKISKTEFGILKLSPTKYPVYYGKGNFYYAVEEKEKYYMLFIYAEKQYYSFGVDVITYNKKWKIIDSQELSQHGGDGGAFWVSKCTFSDENTFEVLLQRDFCTSPEQNFENICEKSITQYKIQSNGQIDSLSTKYLIKQNGDDCYQKGVEFMDKMNKK